jgi:hypothetical protein
MFRNLMIDAGWREERASTAKRAVVLRGQQT